MNSALTLKERTISLINNENSNAKGIDYTRLYEYRFLDIPQSSRNGVWGEIAPWIFRQMGSPNHLLDPAAGRGEFIKAAPAPHRTAIDQVNQQSEGWGEIDFVLGDALNLDLPAKSFDGIFVSNFLEHLATQNEVADFLHRMFQLLSPGGSIAIMGPNFRYCTKEYFDFADHTLPLTHRSVEEHLAAAKFEIVRVIPKFLPFSFKSSTPRSPFLVKNYLRFSPAWKFLGKQFLVIATRPRSVNSQ